MAYCRREDRSDIYLYDTGCRDGFCCDSCLLRGGGGAATCYFALRSEVLAHLDGHAAAGHRVPPHAFEDVENEIAWLGDANRDVYLVDCGNGRVECRHCSMPYLPPLRFPIADPIVLESKAALATHQKWHERRGEIAGEPYSLPVR